MYLTKNCFFRSLILLAVAWPSLAQPTAFVEAHAGQAFLPRAQAQEALDEQLSDWQAFDLELSAIERQVRTRGQLTLQLGGQTFHLELAPVDLLAPDFRAVRVTADGREIEDVKPTGTYRGSLTDHSGSEVRLVVLPNFLRGYIRTEDEWFFLDPMIKFDRGVPTNQIVMYRDSDVRPGGHSLCGSSALQNSYERFDITEDEIFGHETANLVTTAFQADLATEADFEFQQIFGSLTNFQIAGIINDVSGIMKPELGVALQIRFMRTWNTSSDPYTSSDPLTLLNEFRNEWNSNPPTSSHDLAHLFTGRNLNGSVIGIAFVGVLSMNSAACAISLALRIFSIPTPSRRP